MPRAQLAAPFCLAVGALSLFAAVVLADDVPFKAGEQAVVNSDGAELKVGSEVVAKLPKGRRFEVTAVNGRWVGCSLSIDGQKRAGWVLAARLSRLPNDGLPGREKPSTKKEGQERKPSSDKSREARAIKALRSVNPGVLQVSYLAGSGNTPSSIKAFDAIKASGKTAGDWVKAALDMPEGLLVHLTVYGGEKKLDVTKDFGTYSGPKGGTYSRQSELGFPEEVKVQWYSFGAIDIGTYPSSTQPTFVRIGRLKSSASKE